MKKDKQKKLDNLEIADGKIEQTELEKSVERIKELENKLEIKRSNPFGTYSLAVFEEKLADMTNLDMQRLCDNVGIRPSGSRKQVRESLLREFKSMAKGNSLCITAQQPAFVLDPSNPKHKKLIKELGRL